MGIFVFRLSKISNYFFNSRWKRLSGSEFPVKLRDFKKYIFFSFIGFSQFVIFLILLLFSLNYSSNVGVALACFLWTVHFFNIFRNYFSIRRVEILGMTQTSHDENQKGAITFHILYRKFFFSSVMPLYWMSIEGQSIPIFFSSEGLADVIWDYGYKSYGVYQLPRIKISTLWPSFVTECWVDVRLAVPAVIAPSSLNISHQLSSISLKKHDSLDVNTHTQRGDVNGIRDVLPFEHPNKISWKHTFKYGHLMTYIFEHSKEKSVIISWPNGQQTNKEKIVIMREQIDYAVVNNLSFQIIHPKFSSLVGQGSIFGISTLSKLMLYVLPVEEWPLDNSSFKNRDY